MWELKIIVVLSELESEGNSIVYACIGAGHTSVILAWFSTLERNRHLDPELKPNLASANFSLIWNMSM